MFTYFKKHLFYCLNIPDLIHFKIIIINDKHILGEMIVSIAAVGLSHHHMAVDEDFVHILKHLNHRCNENTPFLFK